MSVAKPSISADAGPAVLGMTVLGPAGPTGAGPAPADPPPLHTTLPAAVTIPRWPRPRPPRPPRATRPGANAGDTATANALNPLLTKGYHNPGDGTFHLGDALGPSAASTYVWDTGIDTIPNAKILVGDWNGA